MVLSSPISLVPPPITKADGTVKSFPAIVLTELDVTIIDNARARTVMASLRPCPRPLMLWTGNDYAAIGDYTQARVEAKILELLGNNPTEVLQSLFVPPQPPVRK